MNEHFQGDNPFRTSQLEEADGPGHNPTANPTMGEIIAARFSRRGFLKGSLAVSAIAATVGPLALLSADEARAAGRFGLLLHRGRGRHRRDAPRRRGLRRRRAAALGRSALCRCAGLRSDRADRRRAAQAVRLQQRLRRLHPARRLGRARPARRQPRIHQPAPDVPGHGDDQRRRRDRSRAAHQGAGRHRDGGPWRHDRRDHARKTASGSVVTDGKLQPPHHRRHRNGAHRPGRRQRPASRPTPTRPAPRSSAPSTTAPAA